MGAEQMRTELESFVNQGLQEDWRGWPMKGRLSGQEEFPDADCLVPPAGMVPRVSLFGEKPSFLCDYR